MNVGDKGEPLLKSVDGTNKGGMFGEQREEADETGVRRWVDLTYKSPDVLGMHGPCGWRGGSFDGFVTSSR